MGNSLLIFWGLFSLVFSRTLTTRDDCEKLGPEVYCASEKQMERCEKIDFCQSYILKPICERGPEAYCKTNEQAKTCNKEEYCLTWRDDSVAARKITPYEKITMHFMTW